MAEIRSDIKDRLSGFLNLELFVIETTWVRPVEDMQTLADAHLDHQIDLERRGILFGAGPLFEAGTPRFPPKSGLIIIRASSFEEADEIAASDPMHKSGMRTYSIRRWLMNEGSLSLTLNFSDQTMRIG
jgi:uncharacterized protein